MEFEKYMELLQKYKELCSGEIERRKLYDFQINILDEIVALENLVRENEAKIKEQKGRKANNRQEIIEISNYSSKRDYGCISLYSFFKI